MAQRELDDLFSLVYEELRRLASMVKSSEAHATISSTALLHEAWMKLRDSPPVAAQSMAHFKAIAARAMRQVLVDQARRRAANKRGAGEVVFVSYEEASEAAPDKFLAANHDLLALDACLHALEVHGPRQAKVFEARFFGGLSIAEIAEDLGVSESAIERDWRAAKAWLGSKIHPDRNGKPGQA
jgi:RNA polymerase sigma factor (TIGR02999 family)